MNKQVIRNFSRSLKSNRRLVGSIDQGTTSSRFILFDPYDNFSIVGVKQLSHSQIYPNAGWIEHDPIEILENTRNCIEGCMDEFFDPENDILDSVGITNQRETIVLWDKETGKPLYNAIVWSDLRNEELVEEIIKKSENGMDEFRSKTGLPISTYFSGMKLKWAMENIESVQDAISNNRCMFGTIDTWLIYNLTNGNHFTDVSNASRTMLMNLDTCEWDNELFDKLEIPRNGNGVTFPSILSNAEDFGELSGFNNSNLQGIRIFGCVGDQQSAMIGHRCFEEGMAKNTFGTGCFLLSNIGKEAVESKHGLLTTVLYKIGQDDVTYALEGSIPAAGSAVEWLKNNLGLFDVITDNEKLANEVENSGGVYFVPAFSGLFAPHWDNKARGTILGLTPFVQKGHICRALLEGICFEAKEVLDAMELDSEVKINTLKVDGGVSQNNLMMQIQSDILNVPIVRPKNIELTAIGASICAGLGSGMFQDFESIPIVSDKDNVVFNPEIEDSIREENFANWKRAVERAKDWSI